MHETYEFLEQLVNPESIIQYGGIYLLLFVIFAETGLFIGFFLPGDSLLFTAGLLSGDRLLQIHFMPLILLISLAAILGNWVGYMFGRKVGILLFKRKTTFFFKQTHLQMAHDYYEKHGVIAIILSRFIPIIRTFAPIVAGVVKQDFYLFMFYNIIGAFLWTGTLVTTGFLLGEYIPNINNYLGYIVIFLIVITTTPLFVKRFRRRS